MMNVLILCIFLSSTVVYKVNAVYCAEQKCVTVSSSWCCPFSTTCGNAGTCNNATSTFRDSRCPGQHACYSTPYYWCCDDDQTCGDFRRCEGGGAHDTSTTPTYVGVGVGVLAFLLSLCACAIRQNRKMASTNQANLSAHSSRMPMSPYSFTNMSRTTLNNPLQKPFTIPISSPQVVGDQAPPPAYPSVSSPSATEEQNGV